MKRRVVITGLGCVTALGTGVEDVWKRILAGESGISEITMFDTSAFKVHFGGEVKSDVWTTEGYIDHRETKRVDRFTQFGLTASADAVKDSGLDFEKEDAYRCGAIIGSGIGGLNEIEEQERRLILKGPDRVSAFTIPKLMLNAAAGHISIRFGLRGPNYAVATACTSAANAMGDAFKSIQYDDADVMVTGGTEAALTPIGLSGFANMKALSTRNDAPAAASRPFDAGRDGFVLSEGAGILVFEELEHAKARGAKIYGEVLGYGSSADAGHITQPDAEGTGAARAMSAALRDAQVEPSAIDYINAHGTSTPLGDKAETTAVKRVFEDHAKVVNVSSTKSQLGHLLGASGGVEMIFSLLALRDQVCPPTINLDTPDPACDLNYTPNSPQEREVKCVMKNSFGFGGHNASLVAGAVR
ncbi:beta-ketoacyl-ACP synthase II [Adhaeretor mobilis]|uniref:3-oxoacyl-[acyl-carrier-protein] synthase 2 n=1 Tax=Adhaeretor mobilis TaxID=1930276 RepID=A0A517N003_9BACT|nr:beta-ketoacyl-ACP synthase II [Adhaeretor mobilis]QDT00467.1 3-oxoacyl-[acyl-carrier-protein] synthase 2 [Adhaeretor mobilis]